MIQTHSAPTLLLSSSGKILAANEASVRLVAPSQHGVSLIDRSVYDFHITLLPDRKPVHRDLASLLAALAASHTFEDAISSPASQQQDLNRRAEATNVQTDETSSFWDEECKVAALYETDVFVCRQTIVAETHVDERKPTTSRIRARMSVSGSHSQGAVVFTMTFRRPSPVDQAVYSSSIQSRYPGGKGLIDARYMPKDQLDVDNPTSQLGPGEKIMGRLIPHCTGILDADGQALYFSPSFNEFTGLTDKQSLGSGWADVIHPNDVGAMAAAWAETVKTGADHWTWEARYHMSDGSYRYFLNRAQTFRDEKSGEILRWYASMLDIHESVLEKLETERRRQAVLRLLSQADVSMWGVNQAHDLYIREGELPWSPPHNRQPRKSNAVTESMFIEHFDGQKQIECIIQDILDGKSSLATLEHQAGDRWYRTRFVADFDHDMNDLDGKPVVKAVLGITIDVTDVRARAMLQIENERLITNERAARESTRMKSRFLANVSFPGTCPQSKSS